MDLHFRGFSKQATISTVIGAAAKHYARFRRGAVALDLEAGELVVDLIERVTAPPQVASHPTVTPAAENAS